MNQTLSLLTSLTLLTFSINALADVPANAQLLDTVDVVIYAQEGVELVTRSDQQRLSLAGQKRALDEIIFECLITLDAKKHKIDPSEEEVDRYLNVIQRENNLTAQQLEHVFASAGLTKEEGRKELARMQAVNGMMDFKIRSNLIVPRRQVEEYFAAHPMVTQEERDIQQLFVPYDAIPAGEDPIALISRFIKTGTGISNVAWTEPFSVAYNEVADEKLFLFRMQEGDISKPHDDGSGYETYRVLSIRPARTRTLEECYVDIVNILRQPMFEQKMKEYREYLFSHSSMVRLNS